MRPTKDAIFASRLADVIQEFMPWPYSDVSRYDAEGRQSAVAIAVTCAAVNAPVFKDLRGTAKESKR